MTNTALRAGAQSATSHKESVAYGDYPYDITHMVFANEEHEKLYYEKLEQARYQDCYHKALIYILGISEDTRNHFSQIYDIKSGYIKTDLENLSDEKLVALVQKKLGWYKPQSVLRVEIPKGSDPTKKRPLGIPTILDRLIQQCVLQVLEPICEAKS